MKIIYRAEDGKDFDTDIECIRHEEELKAQTFEAKCFQVVKETWKKFTGTEMDEPMFPRWEAEIEPCIPYYVLKMGATLEEIKEFINSYEVGKKMNEKINYKKIEAEIITRRDWESALRKAKHGDDLSPIVRWAFSDGDIKELALLHKANKFRRKIEDLLEDCNFHSVCGDFATKNYSQYIA